MTKEQILPLLHELLELPAGTLTGAEPLSHVESWDSLAVISYLAMVDERCGKTLAPKDLATCTTVNDLLGLACT